MCVIAAKYLKSGDPDNAEDDIGWVAVKCRDRNYYPTMFVKQNTIKDVEATFIVDSISKYSEGINQYGVGILNAATSVSNDESQITLARKYEKRKLAREGKYNDPDGIKIRRALRMKTPEEAAQSLIDDEMNGHTLIINQDKCLILEGGMTKKEWDYHSKLAKLNPEHVWGDTEYTYSLKEVPKDETIVRTNHGFDLPWLGYSSKNRKNTKQVLSRTSSEHRHDTVVENMKDAETVDEMIKAISDVSNPDPQLNPTRGGDYVKFKFKTTSQLCIIPKNKELITIPIWSNTSAENFDKANSEDSATFFSIRPFRPYDKRKEEKKKVEESISFSDYLKNLR